MPGGRRPSVQHMPGGRRPSVRHMPVDDVHHALNDEDVGERGIQPGEDGMRDRHPVQVIVLKVTRWSE